MAIVLLALLPLLGSFAHAGKIDHFVVLFMENRAFDHIFGCAKDLLPGIDGIHGQTLYLDPNNHSKGRMTVTCGTAEYVCKHGPEASFTKQRGDIFGPGTDASKGPYPNASMDWWLNVSGPSALQAFSPEQLPVKIALAKEFAVFNRLYAAHPGPSQPNHMFAQSATACGVTDTGVSYTQVGGWLPLFPQKTIYDSLVEAGKDFALYNNGTIADGFPGDIYMIGLLDKLAGRWHSFNEEHTGFFAAAAAGTLPHLSWLTPRYGGKHPNDDHPCHDVALGEELLKSVYEALRASPKWNETALLVVYDDPGGWYDHAPTPVEAPPPDSKCDHAGKTYPDQFAFDRLGIRLANLLISPLISKGRVIQDPEGPPGTATRPASNSKFELTSIPATLKNLFGLGSFLTKRDAWAGSFHGQFNLTEPRTDTIMHLPDAPPPSGEAGIHGCRNDVEGWNPMDVTRRQRRHISLVKDLLEMSTAPELADKVEAANWIAEHMPKVIHKMHHKGFRHLAQEL